MFSEIMKTKIKSMNIKVINVHVMKDFANFALNRT